MSNRQSLPTSPRGWRGRGFHHNHGQRGRGIHWARGTRNHQNINQQQQNSSIFPQMARSPWQQHQAPHLSKFSGQDTSQAQTPNVYQPRAPYPTQPYYWYPGLPPAPDPQMAQEYLQERQAADLDRPLAPCQGQSQTPHPSQFQPPDTKKLQASEMDNQLQQAYLTNQRHLSYLYDLDHRLRALDGPPALNPPPGLGVPAGVHSNAIGTKLGVPYGAQTRVQRDTGQPPLSRNRTGTEDDQEITPRASDQRRFNKEVGAPPTTECAKNGIKIGAIGLTRKAIQKFKLDPTKEGFGSVNALEQPNSEYKRIYGPGKDKDKQRVDTQATASTSNNDPVALKAPKLQPNEPEPLPNPGSTTPHWISSPFYDRARQSLGYTDLMSTQQEVTEVIPLKGLGSQTIHRATAPTKSGDEKISRKCSDPRATLRKEASISEGRKDSILSSKDLPSQGANSAQKASPRVSPVPGPGRPHVPRTRKSLAEETTARPIVTNENDPNSTNAASKQRGNGPHESRNSSQGQSTSSFNVKSGPPMRMSFRDALMSVPKNRPRLQSGPGGRNVTKETPKKYPSCSR